MINQVPCAYPLGCPEQGAAKPLGDPIAAVVRRFLTALMLAITFASAAAAQQWKDSNPDKAPAKYVGTITAFYRDGRINVGSGVLIGRRHVLTAAHCLFDKDRKWAGRPEAEWKPVTIMFTPGARRGSAPFGSANATSWWISMPFFKNEDQDRDVGVIRLNRDLGDRTGGWAALAEWPNEWTMDVTVYGYRYGDGGLETPRKISFRAYNTTSWWYTFRGWHQFYSSDAVTSSVAAAGGGASGGPAFANGKVVGVFNGVRSSLTSRLRGFRMSNIPLNEIREWVRTHP